MTVVVGAVISLKAFNFLVALYCCTIATKQFKNTITRVIPTNVKFPPPKNAAKNKIKAPIR